MDKPNFRLAEVASLQHGAFSRDQAIACGFSLGAIAHRVDSGQWALLHEGVYLVSGCPKTPESILHGTLLKMGEGTAISHTSAAWAWGLISDLLLPIHVTSSLPSRRVSDVCFHRRFLATIELCNKRELPVTSIPRTMLDMWAVAPGLSDAAMDRALRWKVTTLNELSGFLRAAARQGVPGVRRFRGAIMERALDPKTVESPLERRFLKLVRRSNLPPPAIQHEVRDDFGIGVRLDFAYPEQKLAIEVDGFEFHSSAHDWLRDRRKMNLLAKLGWLTIHVTKLDLDTQPIQIISAIQQALDISSFSSTSTPDGVSA